jgi:hypothetical protein
MFGDIFSSSKNIEKFIELKTVVLDNIISQNLLYRLKLLPKLSSLIINPLHRESLEGINFNFQLICSLPALKYCKLSYNTYVVFHGMASPIEHLVINNRYNLDTLHDLLLCVPSIRRLSLNYLFGYSGLRIKRFPKVLDKLTYVSLTIKDIAFSQLEPFIRDLFHHLQVFRISTDDCMSYFDGNRWERLISSSTHHLRIFDFQCSYIKFGMGQQLLDLRTKQFKSSFWTERQWYFTHQYRTEGNMNYGIFYSIPPYRYRKEKKFFSIIF